MTIAQRKTLRAANARRHLKECPRCAQEALIESLQGSALWRQLQTPVSELIDRIRGLQK